MFDHINKHKYKSWYLKYYVYYIILYVYVYLLSFHLIEFLLQIGGHDLIETSGNERWMEVEATNTHPKYSSATFSNDFAIMTLKDEVVFNQVQSILFLRFNYLWLFHLCIEDLNLSFFISSISTWRTLVDAEKTLGIWKCKVGSPQLVSNLQFSATWPRHEKMVWKN